MGSFDLDWKALLAVLLGGALVGYLWRWRRNFAEPSISYSEVEGLDRKQSWRVAWVFLPTLLMWVAFIAFCCAFIDPHFFVNRRASDSDAVPARPVEGIAIYLILDQSGSMKEEVVVETPKGGLQSISKIDLLKQVSRQFILGDPSIGLTGRPDDLIGLVFFARGAHVMSPLTLDHRTVLQELDKFKEIGDKDQDGTSIGYALFKTANMIAATRHYEKELAAKGESVYEIKSSVMVLITDGLQDPNPLDKGKRLRNMDVPEAAEYIKEQGIRLYIANIDPGMSTKEFEPYQHIMQRAAGLTGGKFFMVENGSSLEQIYKEIDKLEKSVLPPSVESKEDRPDLYRRISLYPYLIMIGLIALLVSICLESWVFRRVP